MPATRGGEAAGAGKGRGQLATGQQRFGAGRRRASGPATAAKAPAATTTASTGRSQLALAVAGGVPAGQRPRGRQGRVARPLASATAPEPSVAVALAQPTPDRTATAATPTQQPAAADSLGGRAAVLARQVLALPMPLAAGLAPQTPLLPRSRRWAVQVLAGPTLSYRSLGAGAATPSALATAAPTYTSSVTVADTSRARLERPALGWGAQVQLRRVLAGRWALAVGAGYHEYATRLALDVTTYRLDSATNRLTATTTAVRQRDTYRVLTVPVQLSYLLGPRGPLQLGVLAGAEPTLYLGGRSTEASSCSCQQQVFTSAAGSPYRSLSLALSLGLDARYRLGGPASGWQLLAQPTARYVATPFVRSSALGYLGRQPYSLGLLLGVAWEW